MFGENTRDKAGRLFVLCRNQIRGCLPRVRTASNKVGSTPTLPFDNNKAVGWFFNIGRIDKSFWAEYKGKKDFHRQNADTLSNALAKMLIYLITNGLLKVEGLR